MSNEKSESPRSSPRLSRPQDDNAGDMVQPGTIKILVRYAETGDSQVLYFSNSATVEELKRQVMEYAEHGVSCKISSMILLLDNGTSLVKATAPLSGLSSFTVFMFSRDTLLKSFVPTVALEDFKELDLGSESDSELKKELCERCLTRCRSQIDAGSVALKNLEEHAKSAASSLKKFRSSAFTSYIGKASVLFSFSDDMETLSKAPLARPSNRVTSSVEKRSMLDALPKEKIRKWAEEATRQHEFIEQKVSELSSLSQVIDDGCEQVRTDWKSRLSEFISKASKMEKAIAENIGNLDQVIDDLKAFKNETTSALFPTLLRSISSLQSRIQDMSNRLAALKEGLVVQEQKIAQISIIRLIPDAYRAGLKEADRRRQFVKSFSGKITQLTDYVAKERDRELERREQFQRQYGKILPAELVPGLSPWVFPACEVTQRPIDPVLFANVLEYFEEEGAATATPQSIEPAASTGELLFEADSGGLDSELTAMEILELQAENEALKIQLGSNANLSAIAKLKEQYEKETERLRLRVSELEARLSVSQETPKESETEKSADSTSRLDEQASVIEVPERPSPIPEAQSVESPAESAQVVSDADRFKEAPKVEVPRLDTEQESDATTPSYGDQTSGEDGKTSGEDGKTSGESSPDMKEAPLAQATPSGSEAGAGDDDLKLDAEKTVDSTGEEVSPSSPPVEEHEEASKVESGEEATKPEKSEDAEGPNIEDVE